MNQVIAFLVTRLLDIIVGSGVVDRVIAAIRRWANAEFNAGMPEQDKNSQKRAGVLGELESWGKDPLDPCPILSDSWRRLVLELAIRLAKAAESKP
jgi:hypothetical protein